MKTKLASEQIKMLEMSEDDIANGRIISEDDLEFCPKWMRKITSSRSFVFATVPVPRSPLLRRGVGGEDYT